MYEIFSKAFKNEFKTAVVNEPSVFEPLKVYCIHNEDVHRKIQAETEDHDELLTLVKNGMVVSQGLLTQQRQFSRQRKEKRKRGRQKKRHGDNIKEGENLRHDHVLITVNIFSIKKK